MTDKRKEKLVISANLSCLSCNTETFKLFNSPGITYTQFRDEKPKLICPLCKHVFESIPVFVNGNGNGETKVPDEGSDSAAAATAKPTKAEIVLGLAQSNCSQLFTDEYKIPHAAITVNDHVEVLPVRSRRFSNWLARTVYKEIQLVIDSQIIKDVTGVLSANAIFDGQSQSLGLRVTEVDDKWYYDLTNDKWEFIEITGEVMTNLVF